jgi:hypothetical protein
MRYWWIPALILVAACGDDDDDPNGPGVTPEAPTTLTSTSLDGAVALIWSDNPFRNDPDIFANYRVYSTSFDIDSGDCGSDFSLEGTTVAPEFLVAALTNGVPRCFTVTAESVDGLESDRSPLRGDTPRFDSRNVALAAAPVTAANAGFRFWDDDGNGTVELGELGVVRSANSPDIDFFVDRDGDGALFLTPVRVGTGVEYYDEEDPVQDLTSIDFAPDLTYRTTPIEAVPGFGYVFEMDGGDDFPRYGAVRIQHVGSTFLILDWAYQPDPGNPELIVRPAATR